MKKISSNQTDVFKRKNALRYAVGGELTQPPVLGKTRAAADAAIDAEAVKGTGLAAEQPAPVTPSITAPPPAAPAPTLSQGNYPAAQLLRSQPNNSVMSRLRGTNTFQFQDGGMIPGEPGTALFPPDRAHGGPSRMRLGANSGIPGFPPAFADGGSLTFPNPMYRGPTQSTQIRAMYSTPTQMQDEMEFQTKTGMYARPGSGPSLRNPNDPVDYTVATERAVDARNAQRAQEIPGLTPERIAAAQQVKADPMKPFIGRFPGDSKFDDLTPAPVVPQRRGWESYGTGGPITDHQPKEQGKDNQVVLAAAGEYILPKKTVDAMGGPDTLDHIVRATNGKEPNNSNGSTLRANSGYYNNLGSGTPDIESVYRRPRPPSKVPTPIDKVYPPNGISADKAQQIRNAEILAKRARAMVNAPPPAAPQPTSYAAWDAANPRTGAAPQAAPQAATRGAQNLNALRGAVPPPAAPAGVPAGFEGYPGQFSKTGATLARAKSAIGLGGGGAGEAAAVSRFLPTPAASAALRGGAALMFLKQGWDTASQIGQMPQAHYNHLTKTLGVDPMRLPTPGESEIGDMILNITGALASGSPVLPGTTARTAEGDGKQGGGKKTDLEAERAARRQRELAEMAEAVRRAQNPDDNPAPAKPEYSKLRGVMDGVDVRALMTPAGFSANFGKMLANRGQNTANLFNNRQQMAEQQLAWDRDKFNLQRQWDMQRYGYDYAKDMTEKNRASMYGVIDKMYPIADKDGNPLSREQIQRNLYARGIADETAAAAGGHYKMTPADQNETLVQVQRGIDEMQARSGIPGAFRNITHGGPFSVPKTAADLMPNGPDQVGVLMSTTPTPSGPVNANVPRGSTNAIFPGVPPRMADIEARNRVPNYEAGGRIKSKLRSGGC